jgi:hypothetical protein
MKTNETDNQRGRANDRDDSSGSGRVGTEMGSDSGRQAVSRGSDGRRRGGGLHLGVRGLDQVTDNSQLNYWKVLDEIREALVEINQTLKTKL